MIAIGGPPGSGKTTLAIGFADTLSNRGRQAVKGVDIVDLANFQAVTERSNAAHAILHLNDDIT